MKKTLMLLALVISTASLTFYSCTKDEDPCEGIICQNGGNCVSGVCACPQFISGTLCDTEDRKKYYGTYIGELNYNGFVTTSTVVLSKSGSDVSRIKWDSDQYIVLTGAGTFTIPEQDFGGNTLTSGSGTFSGKNLSMSYELEDSSNNTYTVTFTGSK